MNKPTAASQPLEEAAADQAELRGQTCQSCRTDDGSKAGECASMFQLLYLLVVRMAGWSS